MHAALSKALRTLGDLLKRQVEPSKPKGIAASFVARAVHEKNCRHRQTMTL